MKTYRLSFAQSVSHVPEHPERTASRNMNGLEFDVIYQVWPSRAAMLKTIQMQGKREHRQTDWRACKVPTAAVNNRPTDVQLPDGWTWERVEEQRAKWGVSPNMVPVAVVPGACVAWVTANAARQMQG